jgi:acyl transferase domain-containing protein
MLSWAYRDAGVDPADVDFVEAHGTGAPKIDLVELSGLNEVLGKNRPANRPCFVGSIKTNIGHTESAAGVAALIKTVLCLENRRIVPSLHFDRPNPHISWDKICLTVPTTCRPLPDRDRPAVAGISSQGMSCVNAHLVLQEAGVNQNAARQPAMLNRPHLFVLSARTLAGLDDLALTYIDYLQPGAPGYHLELRDICHSTATRRQHHLHRLAIIAPDHQTLTKKLHNFLGRELADGLYASSWSDQSESEPDNTMCDSDQPNPTDPQFCESQLVARMDRLARFYTRGQPADWAEVIEQGSRFVALPTYPWQKKRY